MAKAPPDGYTLLFASTSLTTNPASGKKLPYDPLKDLAPIGEVGAGPFVVVVSKDLGVTTLGEFVALARAKPKSINYGSAGVGGIDHLGTELLAAAAEVQLVHVPYRGIGPAFTDLVAGNLQMLLPTLASVAQPSSRDDARLGRHRRATVTACARAADCRQAGLPDFVSKRGGACWARRGCQRQWSALNDELNAALAAPACARRLRAKAPHRSPARPRTSAN